ncbi:MAG TPA: nucleoside-diphosphate sugar epimerase/dehydratase [Clostridia bacterium]|nr:nucleoside-diphosphate sugar epimerase/dehydratase [Clostridia bacterium]
MEKSRYITRGLFIAVIDVIAVFIAVTLGVILRLNSFDISEYAAGIILTATIYSAILLIAYLITGLYRSLWKFASVEELLTLIMASLVTIIIVFILNFVLGRRLPNSTFAIAFLVQGALSGGFRFSYRVARVIKNTMHHTGYQTENLSRVVVIGGSYEAVATIKSYREGNNQGQVVAVIDRYNQRGSLLNGIPIMGTLTDLETVIKETRASEAVIASEYFTENDVSYTLDVCSRTKCRLRKYNSVGELGGRNHIVDIDPLDLLGRPQVVLDVFRIHEFLKGQTILVTGGGGSIGSELVKQVAAFEPKRIIILDIYENCAYLTKIELNDKYPNLPIDVEIGSVRDEKRVDGIFNKYRPSIVFHAAAHKHVPLMEKSPAEALKNNIIGTYTVARYAARYNTAKFVLVSTDKAVNPTNIMGASKRVAELIISAFDKINGTDYSAVRFGNVLGSSGSVVPIFKQQIMSGGPIKVTHPDIKRFFMTIPEACQLVIQAGAMAKGGEIFILDMQKPVKIKDLAESMIMMYGMIPGVDIEIKYTGLRPGEKLYEELMLDDEAMETDHEKIFVAKTAAHDMEYIEGYMKEIQSAIDDSADLDTIIKLLQKAVPEFIPADIKRINRDLFI